MSVTAVTADSFVACRIHYMAFDFKLRDTILFEVEMG